jgi:hypothetical protein
VASTEELAEFHTLSLKVSDNTATEAERARWRQLRGRLAPGAGPAAPPPPPPSSASLPMAVPMAPLSVPASGPIGANSRQHARATTRKLKVAIAPVTALHGTFTEEVSTGGLKLKLPMNVEPGAAMVVRLEVGLPGPLLVNARVAWCRRDGGHYLVGLSFVGLRDDERERIEAWTSANAVPAGTPPPITKP